MVTGLATAFCFAEQVNRQTKIPNRKLLVWNTTRYNRAVAVEKVYWMMLLLLNNGKIPRDIIARQRVLI